MLGGRSPGIYTTSAPQLPVALCSFACCSHERQSFGSSGQITIAAVESSTTQYCSHGKYLSCAGSAGFSRVLKGLLMYILGLEKFKVPEGMSQLKDKPLWMHCRQEPHCSRVPLNRWQVQTPPSSSTGEDLGLGRP